MAEDDYQSNWRGARRYQFDEEARRKKWAMRSRDDVVEFRRVKWADPEKKLKVLAEDLHQVSEQRAWLERISIRQFCLLALVVAAITFCGVAFLADQ